MIIDFTIEDLLLDSYLQKNFHTPASSCQLIYFGFDSAYGTNRSYVYYAFSHSDHG